MKTCVCGLNVSQARDYCVEKNLAFPNTCIITGISGLHLAGQCTRLLLVGTFSERKDAQDILNEARRRGLKVEFQGTQGTQHE